jgi:hypothetical protein
MIVGGVCERLPFTADAVRVDRRHVGKRVEGLLLGPKPGPRGEDLPPILRLALIDPQQTVAHRNVEVRGPEIGRPPELAVPGMGEFVGHQRARIRVLVPFGEERRYRRVLARLMVFEPDAAHAIGERQQELIMAIVVGIE